MLDIIYVNYLSEAELLHSIGTLSKLLSQVPFASRIFVVDNSFNLGSCDLSHKLHKHFELNPRTKIQYLPSDINLGFGAACNKAARLGTYPLLYFVNCDTDFSNTDPTLFAKHVALHFSSSASIALSGPRVLNQSGHIHSSCFTFDPISIVLKPLRHLRKISIFSSFIPVNHFLRSRIDRISYRGLPRHLPTFVDWLSGCSLFASRQFFDQVGGFDPRYFLYFEDVDLCRKARQLGMQVLFNPTLSIIHTARHQSSSRKGVIRSLLANPSSRYHIISWLKYMWKWRRDFLTKLMLIISRFKRPVSNTPINLDTSYLLDFSTHESHTTDRCA